MQQSWGITEDSSETICNCNVEPFLKSESNEMTPGKDANIAIGHLVYEDHLTEVS